MRDTETMAYSYQQPVLFQWLAVTFSERAPTTNPFLTKSKKSNDRHVQRIRHKHGRRSYLSVGVGGDTQSLLYLEPILSKDSSLVSYNIHMIERMHSGGLGRLATASERIRLVI